MQTLLYRWLLLVGLGHVALGVALAFAAHLPLTQAYFDYLHASVATTPPPAEYQALLRTMVGLFGPTVASWGLLFSVLVVLYRRHGHALIKPAIFAALLLWCLLDSAISAYFGLWLHFYLNSAAALSIAIPLCFLQPGVRGREPTPKLHHLPERRLRILLTGGSGFIGSPLAGALSQAGHEVMVLTRNPANLGQIQGRVTCLTDLGQIDDSEHIDCIINLAGEPLAAARWTPERKRRFLHSRLEVTEALLQLVQRLEHKPETLLSGSAVGYYGHWQDQELDESSAPHDCFSHQLCAQWEQRAQQIRDLGVRVCLLRIGVVLGRHAGPFAELRRSFNLGVASQLGHGRQWMPWIHLHDVLDICTFLLDRPNIEGPVNLTAPSPVTHADFVTLLQQQLPSALIRVRIPAFMVRWLVGEMAEEVLLSGQRVLPAKLLEQGYAFRYPDLNAALQQLTAAH
ncbi:MAG: TIGR01777 family oxidoreductase [Pseudomonadaceae bacterium]|mgnify:CR=1 FL=1|nr:TIGR01777 family oxidoreductase [Pseudomonadaceae bacterium]